MKDQNSSECLPVDHIKNLEKKILLLSKTLEELKEHSKIQYNFYIDKVDIHSPKLDELNYFLEKIDVKELSGAMNIGNTFGTSIEQKQKSRKKNDEAKKEILTKARKNMVNNQFNKMEDNYTIKVVVNGKKVSHYITN